jgi:hypothetical protein
VTTLRQLILIAWHANINRRDAIASTELFTYTDELPQGAEDNVNRASGCGNCDNFLSFCLGTHCYYKLKSHTWYILLTLQQMQGERSTIDDGKCK